MVEPAAEKATPKSERAKTEAPKLDEGAIHAPGMTEALLPQVEYNGPAHELVYWWTPVTHAQAVADEIAAQPKLAENAVAGLISMNPGYVVP